ncbi:hypothetical protein HZC09_04680 [Candidatus Micrarchaeota archaeon]|nr:hypothetical protein [Candidatus Micrarchaeota archaeon]
MTSLKKLNLLGLASLAFGGFLLLSYFAFVYSAVWRSELLPLLPDARPEIQMNGSSAWRNGTAPFPFEGPGRRMQPNPFSSLLSPYAILWPLVGIAFILNGYILLRYTGGQEVKKTREFVISTMLTDDEKTLVKALQERGGAMTQKELSLASGFSAVKTHRAVSKLERKKIVKSFPFGMTKKVVLEQGN